MNILHISKYYYPFVGGVEVICKHLVEHMNHNTSVVCFNDGRKNSVDYVNGHKIYRCSVLLTVARQALSLSYYRILKRAIEEQSPDIIHFHWANPFPAVFLRLLLRDDTKLVVHWHMDIVRQRLLYPLVKPIETWLLDRAERIVVTSPQYFEGSKPLQRYREKIRIVPNCINSDNLKKQQEDDARIQAIKDLYGQKKIVLFVGRHSRYKGLPFLIEACRFLKEDCAIVIAGRGELTDSLKAIVQEAGLGNVHFVGRLSDDDLRCYLYASDIFSFPSVTKNEAFGVALAEAMYCGLPAVTFSIEGSGVNWVNLNGETGLECPNGDALSYAEAIDLLLKDDVLRQQYGRAARERVEGNFMMHHMLDAMERVYDEIQ